MIPTVGRIIHVSQYEDLKCRAAIVGEVVWEVGKIKQLYVSVLNVHNPLAPVVNAVITDREGWHDPRDCPKELELAKSQIQSS